MLTVRVKVLLVTPLWLTVVVQVPDATPVASPLLSIVATPDGVQAQATELVMFAVLLSLYIAVAISWSVEPTVMVAVVLPLKSVTLMDAKVTPVMRPVSTVVPWILVLGSVAVMVVVPVAITVATLALAGAKVTTPAGEAVHVTDAVTSRGPSVKVPVALKVMFWLTGTEGLTGATAIEESTPAMTVATAGVALIPLWLQEMLAN